jgi:membrane-bound ClpP family serine protease
VTTVYLVAVGVGVLAVSSTLVMYRLFLGRTDDSTPPLRILAGETGLIGVGVGGLTGAWAGFDSLGSGLITVAVTAALVLALYCVVFPRMRRRRAIHDRAGYVGLSATVTRDVPADDFGEVSFVDSEGNQVRLPAKSDEAATLTKSTRVHIIAVDDEFIHVAR